MPATRRDAAGDHPHESGDPSATDELQRRLRRDLNRYLRVREHSGQEVELYLTRRGYPAEVRAAALEQLRAERLIDDRRFAEMFVRDRRRLRPMSARMVLRELRARGVDDETARGALAACQPAWDDAAMAHALLAARWSRWPRTECALRARGLLARRGFSAELIRVVIAQRQRAEQGAQANDAGGSRAGEDWR